VTPTPARPGRPKDAAKHAAIVAAATALFGRQAYDTVTMEAVAAQAGVSKMTVYSHFADKEMLFETVVGALSDRMIAAFANPGCGGGALEARLTATGTAFLTIILGAEIAGMAQTLPAVLRGNQILARRFYEAGPGRVRAALARIIAGAAAGGVLSVDAPERAAEDLISLWEGGLPARLAFGLAEPATPDEIARRARRGTAVFLRAYQPAPPG
jgi:TetR/AcrR family transcriptional repressor of mexJK operon